MSRAAVNSTAKYAGFRAATTSTTLRTVIPFAVNVAVAAILIFSPALLQRWRQLSVQIFLSWRILEVDMFSLSCWTFSA